MPRDFTLRQFLAALDRNGFERPVMFWVRSKDDSAVGYGIIADRQTGRLKRRATLAHIITARAKHRRAADREG